MLAMCGLKAKTRRERLILNLASSVGTRAWSYVVGSQSVNLNGPLTRSKALFIGLSVFKTSTKFFFYTQI